jgi:LacI family transcriptional regulator
MAVIRYWLTPEDNPMRPITDFCCQNPDCALYGQKGKENLRQKGWSSEKQQIRALFCKVCRYRFSERKGTALFGSRLKTEKALDVLNHLKDHCGIRQTSRLTGVGKDAVNRLALTAGKHAEKVHEELVAFSPSHPGGPTRREMVVRPEKREKLRTRRNNMRRQLGPRRLRPGAPAGLESRQRQAKPSPCAGGS